jgi:hypothetical protein
MVLVLLAPPGLFLNETETEIEEEECDDMTSKGEFQQQEVTNGMKDIRDMRNIGYGYSDHWGQLVSWWAVVDGDQLKIYSAPDKTTTEYEETTQTFPHATPATNINIDTIILRTSLNGLYAAVSGDYDYSGSNYSFMFITYTLDYEASTISWTTSRRSILTSAGGDYRVLDFAFLTTTYIIYSENIALKTIVAQTLAFAGGGSYFLNDGEHIWAGQTDYENDRYICVGEQVATLDVNKIAFAHSTTSWSSLETLAITIPTNWNVAYQQFWEQDGTELLQDLDYKRTRTADLSAFVELAAENQPARGAVFAWTQDQIRIANIFWDAYLWEWEKGGKISKLHQVSPRDYKKIWPTETQITGVIDWGTHLNSDLSMFTMSGLGGPDTNEVIKELDGHQNVVHNIQDVGKWWAYDIGAPVSSGLYDQYIRMGQTNKLLVIQISNAANQYICRMEYGSDGNIDFRGTALDADLETYNANEWYRITIIFERNNSCYLYVNGVLKSTVTGNNTADSDFLARIEPASNDTEYWVDAMGNSADGYELVENGGDADIAEIVAYVGFDNWFLGDNRIYQYTLIETLFEVMRVLARLYEPPQFTMRAFFPTFANQMVPVYSGENNKLIAKILVQAATQGEFPFTYRCISGIQMDLKNPIEKTFTAKTPFEVVTTSIEDKTQHVWHGRGTNGNVNTFTANQISGADGGWQNVDGATCESTYLSQKTFINSFTGKNEIFKDLLKSFDGATTANFADLRRTTTGTIHCGWFTNDDTTKATFVMFYEGARKGYLQYDGGGIFWFDGGTQTVIATSTFDALDMVHYICHFTGANEVKIYINGILASTETLESNMTTEITQIRYRNSGSDANYTGYHVDVQIANSVDDALRTLDSAFIAKTDTYTLQYMRKEFLDVANWVDGISGRLASWRPDGQYYNDLYAESGIIWTDDYYANYIEIIPEVLRPSGIVVHWNGGVSFALGSETSGGIVHFWHAEIDNQTDGNEMAATRLADKNTVVTFYPIKYVGQMIYVGTRLTFTITRLGVSAAPGFLTEVDYNERTNVGMVRLADKFWQPYLKRAIEDNRQQIENVRDDLP